MPKPTFVENRPSVRPIHESSGPWGWVTDLIAIGAIVALLAVTFSMVG